MSQDDGDTERVFRITPADQEAAQQLRENVGNHLTAARQVIDDFITAHEQRGEDGVLLVALGNEWRGRLGHDDDGWIKMWRWFDEMP
jgi:hypothetical protein